LKTTTKLFHTHLLLITVHNTSLVWQTNKLSNRGHVARKTWPVKLLTN